MISGSFRREVRGVWYALVAYALALSSSFPATAEETSGDPALTVRVEGTAVTVRANSVPLREVLAQLADAGGFKVRILERFPAKNVSIDFESVTMRQALDRLLGGVSHAMVVAPGDPEGSVSLVFVLAQGTPAPADVAPPSPDRQLPPTESAPTLIEVLEDNGELPESVRATLEAQLEILSSGVAETRHNGMSPESLRAALEAEALIAKPALAEEDWRRLVEEMEKILDQVQ
jgi:hypothetical protein